MNHEIPVCCPACGYEYDARLHYYTCPCCGYNRENLSLQAQEQSPPLQHQKNETMNQDADNIVKEEYPKRSGCGPLLLVALFVGLFWAGIIYLFT